jgi:hypothetical protein
MIANRYILGFIFSILALSSTSVFSSGTSSVTTTLQIATINGNTAASSQLQLQTIANTSSFNCANNSTNTTGSPNTPGVLRRFDFSAMSLPNPMIFVLSFTDGTSINVGMGSTSGWINAVFYTGVTAGSDQYCYSSTSGGCSGSISYMASAASPWGVASYAGTTYFVISKPIGKVVSGLSLYQPYAVCKGVTTVGSDVTNLITYVGNVSTSSCTGCFPAPTTCNVSAVSIGLVSTTTAAISKTAVGTAFGTPVSGTASVTCSAAPISPQITVTGTSDPYDTGNTLGLFKNAGTATGVTGQVTVNIGGVVSNLKFNSPYTLPVSGVNSAASFTAQYFKTGSTYSAGTVSSGPMAITLTYQ